MTVAIRADASVELGTGHIARCSRIALHLKSLGYDVIFICRQGSGDQISDLKSQGFAVQYLKLPAPSKRYDWASDLEATRAAILNLPVSAILIDNYALDQNYSSALRKQGYKVIVLDDLADRPHDCDLLIDQNITPETDYRCLVPADCSICTGLRFNTVLLNPAFVRIRQTCKRRSGAPKKILVFFGGADSKNLTDKVLQQLRTNINTEIIAIVGSSNPNAKDIIEDYRDARNITIMQNVSTMPDLIAQSDLAIGSGGVSAWERSFLGLPAILIDSADNQRKVSLALEKAGAARYLGNYLDVNFNSINSELAAFTHESDLLGNMSEAASSLWKDDWITANEIGRAIEKCLKH